VELYRPQSLLRRIQWEFGVGVTGVRTSRRSINGVMLPLLNLGIIFGRECRFRSGPAVQQLFEGCHNFLTRLSLKQVMF